MLKPSPSSQSAAPQCRYCGAAAVLLQCCCGAACRPRCCCGAAVVLLLRCYCSAAAVLWRRLSMADCHDAAAVLCPPAPAGTRRSVLGFVATSTCHALSCLRQCFSAPRCSTEGSSLRRCLEVRSLPAPRSLPLFHLQLNPRTRTRTHNTRTCTRTHTHTHAHTHAHTQTHVHTHTHI